MSGVLLPLSRAAEELGVDASTLRRQAIAGVLRAQKPGRDWMVPSSEIARYRAEHLGRPGRKPKAPHE